MSKKIDVQEITIDGNVYVPKSSISKSVEKKDGMDYVLVRTYSAGVHCGWLKKRECKESVLLEAVRLWKWSGASACSQLAMEGVSDPSGCKFEMASDEVILTESIEIHKMTETAKESILNVVSWKE